MSYDTYDLADDIARQLSNAGYVIHSGNAESGEVVDDGSGEDWWFSWCNGGDVETGETCMNELGAQSDAMAHFFANAKIPRIAIATNTPTEIGA